MAPLPALQGQTTHAPGRRHNSLSRDAGPTTEGQEGARAPHARTHARAPRPCPRLPLQGDPSSPLPQGRFNGLSWRWSRARSLAPPPVSQRGAFRLQRGTCHTDGRADTWTLVTPHMHDGNRLGREAGTDPQQPGAGCGRQAGWQAGRQAAAGTCGGRGSGRLRCPGTAAVPSSSRARVASEDSSKG